MVAKKARYEVDSSTVGGRFFRELNDYYGNWRAKFPKKRPRSDVNDRLFAKAAVRDGGTPEKCPCCPH
jgi:hypothetical protein